MKIELDFNSKPDSKYCFDCKYLSCDINGDGFHEPRETDYYCAINGEIPIEAVVKCSEKIESIKI